MRKRIKVLKIYAPIKKSYNLNNKDIFLRYIDFAYNIVIDRRAGKRSWFNEQIEMIKK